MAYCDVNFKTKKALKEAVAKWNAYQELRKLKEKLSPTSIATIAVQKALERPPRPVYTYQPGPFGSDHPRNGTVYLEGPHYPAAHTWYAKAELRDGVVVKVS